MRRTTTIALIGGVAIGVLGMTLTAGCVPPSEPTTTPHVTESPMPVPWPDGVRVIDGSAGDVVLLCGTDARAAEDVNDADGYWYYCEPALAD